MAKVTYNERSWAIDVISEINVFLENKSWHFKAAGGENTISNNKRSLFPDVLLFKDNTKDIIVQGWELKMPDTQINDAELISNAIKKAKILQRDSFILWNVKSAVLYVRNGDDFEALNNWDDININTRVEVKSNVELWKNLLFEILKDLNDFFESGKIAEVTSKEILSIEDVIDVVLENTPSTAENIRVQTSSNAILDAKINLWWNSSSNEYGHKSNQSGQKLPTLSMVVLTDWVFKIVFAHILKKHFNEAKEIEGILTSSSIEEALAIIESISKSCNFWNIFSPNLGQKFISQTAWNELTELNQFLTTINIEAIEVKILHELLQSSIVSAKRKVAGQYATPKKLAELLTRITISDKSKVVIDPCCGTGTIIDQTYKLKEEYDFNQDQILNTVWASDKHSFPIQLSTLTMAKPSNIGKIINVFNSDVIELEAGKNIEFHDPNTGDIVNKEFPTIDYVVSNLPFISNKDMRVLNPDIIEINDWIREQTGTQEILSGKSDIFAYIPFYLHRLLSEHGRIGLILSNAWLGTTYGETFLNIFQKFFELQYVLISGKGKWFDNADVVTTMLVASKKAPTEDSTGSGVSFCTLSRTLDEIDDIKGLSGNIILQEANEDLTVNSYSIPEIRSLEDFGIPWSAYFSNLNWIEPIKHKFINANDIFRFTRGERRGWNPMFYPAPDHGIEPDYIKPILKNLRDTPALSSQTNKEAFCCSRSMDELLQLGHNGAINWINSFVNQNNNSGMPLTTSLSSPNMFWYEMKTDNMADFVGNVNYDRSLFISKLEERSFIDQRLIGLSIIEEQQENDLLYLALLNSTVSMFFIESFGFGRGLGALDLRATKFEKDFKILDPTILTERQKATIIEAFTPLMQRDRLPLEEEIKSADRVLFENVLMDIYGISEYFEDIKTSLKQLYRIRFAVKD